MMKNSIDLHLKMLEDATWAEALPVDVGGRIFRAYHARAAERELVATRKRERIERYRVAYEKLDMELPRPIRIHNNRDSWDKDDCNHFATLRAMVG